MSLDDVHREQQAHRCACIRLSARDCIRARYPRPWHEEEVLFEEDDERCECSCHDGKYDEDDDR